MTKLILRSESPSRGVGGWNATIILAVLSLQSALYHGKSPGFEEAVTGLASKTMQPLHRHSVLSSLLGGPEPKGSYTLLC